MPGIFHTIEHASGSQSGLLAGTDPDHLPGLVAALLAPAVAWGFLKLTRVAASHGFGPAVRFTRGYDEASPVTRAAALLLFVTGFIHLGLVPGHATVDPLFAQLFALNGLAFVGVAIGALLVRRWRPFAAALLVATVIAYLTQVGGHNEDADAVGMLTKLIELIALGLVLVPDRVTSPRSSSALRWSGAVAGVLMLTVITGTVTWAVGLQPAQNQGAATAARSSVDNRDLGGIGTTRQHQPGMVVQAVPSTPPTVEQRAAAEKLVADTRAGIAKYADVKVAIADGYRPSTAANGDMVHYTNRAYTHDGKILDPTRPEALVYANTRHGTVLLGALYMMQQAGQPGPDIGGSLTQWHIHSNICWSLTSMMVAGFATPFGSCPAGSIHVTSSAMMHVWTIPNPTGGYGDLDPAWLAQLIKQQ
ncbi:MAG: hypothetical protein ACYDCQ_01655 [Dehalococcoidia bacterium]